MRLPITSSLQLHVHTEAQVSKFYEFVPKELMPADYGGSAPTAEDLHGEP